MKIIDSPISLGKLKIMAEERFGNLERIEFDSVINLRPSQGNRSRGVDDLVIREKIAQTVTGLMK